MEGFRRYFNEKDFAKIKGFQITLEMQLKELDIAMSNHAELRNDIPDRHVSATCTGINEAMGLLIEFIRGDL